MADMTSSTASAPITIRRATDADVRSIERLAALDSQRTPAAPHLVALSGDRLVAAASLADGRWVSDPFVASAEIVGLLRERVADLTGVRATAAPHRGFDALRFARGLFPASPAPRPSRSA
jgi:hypothetical protein